MQEERVTERKNDRKIKSQEEKSHRKKKSQNARVTERVTAKKYRKE